MKLKDARNILIDNDDVQRIKMFNEVVWEKNKPTKLLLTASTTSTSFLNSYTLLATLSEDDNSSSPINGVVEFYEDNGNESILLGKANTAIDDNNTATARYTISTKDIGTHTYYAVFNQNEKYHSSTSTAVNINVKKDTPKLTLLGDTNIYNTWSIGVKLTNSKGTALSGRKIQYGNASAYTDSKGKATFYISGKTTGSNLSVTYNFQSIKKANNQDTTDTEYDTCSLTKKYKILSPTSIESKITKLEQTRTANGKEKPYQKWYTLNTNGVSVCGEKNSNYTAIGTAAGTWKRPGPLKATFTKINGKIFDAKFSYSDSLLPGMPSQNGGYPKINGPEITINNSNYSSSSITVNSSPTKGTPKNGPPSTDSYKTHSVSWSNASGSTMSTPTITINYPANTGNELGILYLKSLKLTFTYIPTQKAL